MIGADVTHAIQDFFTGGTVSRAVNHTFLTRIPKQTAANQVDQFRLIASCNVIYKVITKILANRLKDRLNSIIHPSQATFIPSRSILDNCIIHQEVMHYLNREKGKTGFLAIKVNMAKAYDLVEWNILKTIILAHGFSYKFCELIMECVSLAYFSVLVNGSPCGFFQGSRGIRQEDPISPTLFVLLADLLSRILSRAKREGKISGIKISRTSPRITYLMYADDLVIYCKAKYEEVREVKACVDLYCQWSGQRINWEKSEVHFSSNVGRTTRTALSRVLNMKECAHEGKYLGSPFCRFRTKNTEFNYVVDKLATKLAGWKSRHLSMAGRTTLIRAVTSVLLSYIMQLYLLPVSICNKIDRLNWRFLVNLISPLFLLMYCVIEVVPM